ncbi:hypothetical protein SORBI_3001G285500 [Sorghum bicolor]|uniref:Uncharacterized protein n=1 Tax=Sorghum bicolor TaxID=4558 RepID=A0A1B6QLM2_SORBI|nr:hypothetical protein SORBI_3001G285500 [Sorghum bicolor]
MQDPSINSFSSLPFSVCFPSSLLPCLTTLITVDRLQQLQSLASAPRPPPARDKKEFVQDQAGREESRRRIS